MKWFKKSRLIHKPNTWQAYVLYLLAILFLITVITAVDRDSHSVSDTFYGIFPYFVCTFLLIEWIASKTS